MYKPVNLIEVMIWGKRVGAVTRDPSTGYYAFEYDPDWVDRGIELSPFAMPLIAYRKGINNAVKFLDLPIETFQRLPAMLADALPDAFGNALITAALSEEGLAMENITTLDRLAYMGDRAMGALEFRPPRGKHKHTATAIQLSLLVEGARKALQGAFDGDRETEAAIKNILQVGISAGGARAKAIIAWNKDTKEIRSGQLKVGDGFEHWLIKLDGVGKDLALGTSGNYGRIEYAYHLMAKAAGVHMMECSLLEENGRAHFMTKRFDREGNDKHHIQTLCAMRHVDFKAIGVHSYNQYFDTLVALNLGMEALQEGFRRMAFNVMSSNCDDHPKNFSFILKRAEGWALSPAYDVTHAHNPSGAWTFQHFMSVNGKFKDIERADLMAVADRFQITNANDILDAVLDALSDWDLYAEQAGVPTEDAQLVRNDFKPVGRRLVRAKLP